MWAANLAYFLNVLLLVCYIIFFHHKSAWPQQFILWAWLPVAAFFILNKIIFNLQNTTYNIARVYLMQKHGLQFNKSQVALIQIALIPETWVFNSVLALWYITHVTSFTIILFFQGWATAICCEVGAMIFTALPPFSQQWNLKLIYRQTTIMSVKTKISLLTSGISVEDLFGLISHTFEQHINPGRLWVQIMDELINKKV